MKTEYDPEVDIMTIEFREGAVAESDEVAPGFVIDLDDQGHVLGIEIMDARSDVANAEKYRKPTATHA